MIRHVGTDDEEFVSTDATELVAGSQSSRHSLCAYLEDAVPDAWP